MERQEALETLQAIESSVAKLGRIQASRHRPARSGDADEQRRNAAACLAMLAELYRPEALVQALKVYLTAQYVAAERAFQAQAGALCDADDMEIFSIRMDSVAAKLPLLPGMP